MNHLSIPVFNAGALCYDAGEMQDRAASGQAAITGEQALQRLIDLYGTDNLTDLARAAQVPRQTLKNWSDRPGTEVRGPSLKHLKRAEASAPPLAAAAPDRLAAVERDVSDIKAMLTQLLTLRSEAPERYRKVMAANGKDAAPVSTMVRHLVEALFGQREATQEIGRELLRRLDEEEQRAVGRGRAARPARRAARS